MARLKMEEYFQTMYQDPILKKPIREDYCNYLSPATHLLELRRERAEVEKALNSQKEEFQLKMETLKQRREELDKKELQLRRSLEKFDTFLQENDSKKARALKKADDERELTKMKYKEIDRLNSEMEELTKQRADLLKRLQAHKKFHKYMSKVLVLAGDFHETREILSRYQTLTATHQDLLERQQKNNDLLDKQRQLLLKFTEDKNEEKMKCNMELAERQLRLDKAQSHTVACDYLWSDVRSAMSQKTLILGRIIMATDNLYYLMQMFGIRSSEDEEPVTTTIDQLEKIHEFIDTMSYILVVDNKPQKRPASTGAASTKTTVSGRHQ